MENKLEQLLNSLIEKGWRPRNVISKNIYIYKVKDKINLSYSEFLEDEGEVMHGDEWYSLRDIVSKSSGLWQFVCENGMIEHKGLDIHSWEHTTAEHPDFWFTDGDNYEYYIIESSLKDESELEDFLLSNIKVDVESK